MSASAEIVVLFKDRPADGRIPEIARLPGAPKLEELEEPDFYGWVSTAGELEYLGDRRKTRLLGEVSLDGRLFRANLGRYWYPTSPGAYREIVSALLRCTDIQYVWYGPDLTGTEGCRDVPPLTAERILTFFD